MKITLLSAATVLGMAAFAPGIASASFVLDTGTPTGPSVLLSSADWYAEEFTAAPGTSTITALSAYLTEGVGQVGDSFTWDIYSAAGTFLGANREAPTFTATGTFQGNGWNSVTLTSPQTLAPGNYWVALQVTGTSQTRGLDLPTETTASNGTAPALAYASMTSSNRYAATTTGVGMQVSAASPVPLPGAAWLLGSGLLAFGSWARRGRALVVPSQTA